MTATSLGAAPDIRTCAWCGVPLEHPLATYCSKAHRQTAWRARQLAVVEGSDGAERRLAYADPPYPGLSRKYYRDEPSYAGEVDHAELIRKLVTYDGWALSTSQKALRDVLPLCPPGVRVAAWVKPIGVSPATRGAHNTWEPVIFVPARRCRPGVQDWLRAQPARFGGDLMGRKPLAFCVWLFQLLGAQPGDCLDDLFPGTGIVGSSFRQFVSLTHRGDGSLAARADGSPAPGGDESLGAVGTASRRTSETSPTPAPETSRRAPDDVVGIPKRGGTGFWEPSSGDDDDASLTAASPRAALDASRGAAESLEPGRDPSLRYRGDVVEVLRDGGVA